MSDFDTLADAPALLPLVPSSSTPSLILPSSSSPSLSTASSSYVTSPQEPSNETPTANTDFATGSLCLSPQVGMSAIASSLIDSPTVISRGDHLEAVPLSATRSNRSTTSTSVGVGLHPKPLHCRVCLADTCDDITASMCGHLFCNRYVFPFSLSKIHSDSDMKFFQDALQMPSLKQIGAQFA